MRKDNRIKAILFDMDGVLIDAKDWHYEALNEALGLFGISISRYDHINTFDGLPTRTKLEMLSKSVYLPEELWGMINDIKQNNTKKKIVEKCRPVFCHEYALARLKREGYKVAVCSNSINKTIVQMMEMANLLGYIDEVLSNEDVIMPKPAPDIYLTAMERLGVSGEECVVVEDNHNGIEAGKASGANVMEVLNTTDVNYWNIMSFINHIV